MEGGKGVTAGAYNNAVVNGNTEPSHNVSGTGKVYECSPGIHNGNAGGCGRAYEKAKGDKGDVNVEVKVPTRMSCLSGQTLLGF